MTSACASRPASTSSTALITLALCALATTAAAQDAPGPAPAPPPAQPSEDLPPPPPPPTYAQPAGDACTPACRAGYTCQAGQCVSACNPPCAAGEQCTAEGECVPSTTYSEAPAFPEPPADMVAPPQRGVEQHDGFMLRFTLGGGGGGAGLDTGDAFSLELSGGGGAFSFDIGGSPTDDLVIHLRISDFVMVEPDVTIDGGGIINGSSELNGSLTSNMFGLGLTYYFMPINLYLTAALGAGWLTVQVDDVNNDDSRATDAGFAFDFDVGKEWWVSDNWGLGLAGRFSMVSGTDENEDTSETTDYAMVSFALLFSATYQ